MTVRQSESENMINFLCLLFEMMLRARLIAQASAVALYGWPEQMIPLSVLARNQTKDFWT